jgi:hypothetical protein
VSTQTKQKKKHFGVESISDIFSYYFFLNKTRPNVQPSFVRSLFSDRLLFSFYFFCPDCIGLLSRADQHLTVRSSDGVLREPARLRPLPEPPALALHCPARIQQRLSPHLRLVVKMSR